MNKQEHVNKYSEVINTVTLSETVTYSKLKSTVYGVQVCQFISFSVFFLFFFLLERAIYHKKQRYFVLDCFLDCMTFLD